MVPASPVPGTYIAGTCLVLCKEQGVFSPSSPKRDQPIHCCPYTVLTVSHCFRLTASQQASHTDPQTLHIHTYTPAYAYSTTQYSVSCQSLLTCRPPVIGLVPLQPVLQAILHMGHQGNPVSLINDVLLQGKQRI